MDEYDFMFRTLLGRRLNEIEREAVERRLAGEGSALTVETLREEIIASQEFFHINRELIFPTLFPTPCIVTAKTPLGQEIFTDLRQLHLGFAIATGNFEPDETAFIKNFIRPGHRIIDAGANIGYYSLMFASLTGNAGCVYAFEPLAENFVKLQAALRRNNLDNVVRVFTVGLADAGGECDIAYGEGTLNIGGAHIVPSPVAAVPGECRERIRLASLDELLPSERIDFVKMDVEGSEWLVIRGAAKLLKRCHPVMLIEINEPQLRAVSGVTPEFFIDGLCALGYEVYQIGGGGNLMRLDKPQATIKELLRISGIVNVVARCP